MNEYSLIERKKAQRQQQISALKSKLKSLKQEKIQLEQSRTELKRDFESNAITKSRLIYKINDFKEKSFLLQQKTSELNNQINSINSIQQDFEMTLKNPTLEFNAMSIVEESDDKKAFSDFIDSILQDHIDTFYSVPKLDTSTLKTAKQLVDEKKKQLKMEIALLKREKTTNSLQENQEKSAALCAFSKDITGISNQLMDESLIAIDFLSKINSVLDENTSLINELAPLSYSKLVQDSSLEAKRYNSVFIAKMTEMFVPPYKSANFALNHLKEIQERHNSQLRISMSECNSYLQEPPQIQLELDSLDSIEMVVQEIDKMVKDIQEFQELSIEI